MTTAPTPPPLVRGRDTSGNGANGTNGHGGADEPERAPEFPARRNSIFPFLVDLGAVLALFGLIIIKPLYSPLAGNLVLGAGVALVVLALAGWFREARSEYTRLPD
ncbi:MAG: hypothetical protein KA764_18085 [Anaerolineales bacterium]|nr:hypothetical protein [Anaerolineales bacterium]